MHNGLSRQHVSSGEERRAHNPEVLGSKPRHAIVSFLFTFRSYSTCVFFLFGFGYGGVVIGCSGMTAWGGGCGGGCGATVRVLRSRECTVYVQSTVY